MPLYEAKVPPSEAQVNFSEAQVPPSEARASEARSQVPTAWHSSCFRKQNVKYHFHLFAFSGFHRECTLGTLLATCINRGNI